MNIKNLTKLAMHITSEYFVVGMQDDQCAMVLLYIYSLYFLQYPKLRKRKMCIKANTNLKYIFIFNRQIQ